MRHGPQPTGSLPPRIRVFVIGCTTLLLICLLRLGQVQRHPDAALRRGIEDLKRRRQQDHAIKTLRGAIRDRHGRLLATDDPLFSVQIPYDLTRYADPRILRAMSLKASRADPTERQRLQTATDAGKEALLQVLDRGARFVPDISVLHRRLRQENDRIWRLRAFQVWRRRCKQTALYQRHRDQLLSVKPSEYLPDLAREVPDADRRLILIAAERIAEMQASLPLFHLHTNEAVLAAQLAFADIPRVRIASQGVRHYPYEATAAQTIGWVGPATQAADQALFAADPLARYHPGDICGREDGAEYVCEATLRGRRGREVFDLDNILVAQTPAQFGRDVTLTLDIELQARIERFLLRYPHAAHCHPGLAVVVLDVPSADILALVSLPDYDLNTVRRTYGDLSQDPNRPLINRALNKHYKPGSTAKPVILVAGLETGVITPDEVISCPSRPAPAGWPNCWIFRKSHVGHDVLWSNDARHAIQGSCNVYFSHLAGDRLEPRTLQTWLFRFGYGHPLALWVPRDPSTPDPNSHAPRRLRQAPGKISSRPVPYGQRVTSLTDIPPLQSAHRRLVGIGEGEFLATPLQIANTMATLARHGIAITPRLFRPPAGIDMTLGSRPGAVVDLNLAETTLATVLAGMQAVVNEAQGTAHEAFAPSDFAGRGIQVFGKTGSTERPNNALFAGFASDDRGHTLALALVVEGGESGAHDAAPLAPPILEACIDAGYLDEHVK